MRCARPPWLRASAISLSISAPAAHAGCMPANAAPPTSRRNKSRRLAVESCMAAFCHKTAPRFARDAKRLIPHHHQAVVARFSAPDLARTAIELAHIGAPLVAREALELLRHRIEAHD